ncbi:glycosyltransferase family 4 protein [Salegentibacter holothuriorum]|uniref:glycosyltransferase family 4 protein n=1 Tax=Salegentibacter holothuriorum TaxID=241145 RepID=UPI001115E85E|nr:glycosyltransferase family 4 protein [Salegentibacter holothuriorum]
MNQVILAIKLGYEVRILTEEVCDIPKNANQELFREYKLEDKLILEDYKIPKTKFRRALKVTGLIFKRPDLLASLLRFYRKSQRKGFFAVFQFFFYKKLRDYDIIHIQFGTNKNPVDILKKTGFLKSRIIASFHGHDLYFPINNRIPNDGYYDLLFETADSLIANTPFLKEKLLDLGAPAEKIKAIPVAVNTQYFKPVFKKDVDKKIRLVTVGRMDELKGQEYGIRVVNRLIRKGMGIEYFLAGGGIYERRLKGLVKELELDKFVFFVGNLDQKRVCTILQASDIFLMTSVINKAGMEESQGLVTAEAQACGLPVVAFDTGGVKYTLINGETGFLCKEKDLDDFATKLEFLIKDHHLRVKMGIIARDFIEQEYSEISVRKKWRETYG